MTSIITDTGLASGLIGYWAADGNMLDSHTNHLDGTASGTPAYAASSLRQAFSFGGAWAVNLSTDARLIPSTGTGLTLSIWVYQVSGFATPHYFCRALASDPSNIGTSYWLRGAPSGVWGGPAAHIQFGVGTQNGANCYSDSVLPNMDVPYDSKYHNIVGTYVASSGLMSIYYDGYPTISGTKTHGLPGPIFQSTSVPTSIGAASNGVGGFTNFLGGVIDEVAIWNEPKTDEQVIKIFNSGAPLRYDEVTLPGIGHVLRKKRR